MFNNVLVFLAFVVPALITFPWIKKKNAGFSQGAGCYFVCSGLSWLLVGPIANNTLPPSAQLPVAFLGAGMTVLCFYVPGWLIYQGWQKQTMWPAALGLLAFGFLALFIAVMGGQ